ncbi:MAG: hypothetical protein AD742_08765 [Methylibium sp. NZG]|nr:MAG: hypothetical protein AD742_08765 [Methylibium sp. NZG]
MRQRCLQPGGQRFGRGAGRYVGGAGPRLGDGARQLVVACGLGVGGWPRICGRRVRICRVAQRGKRLVGRKLPALRLQVALGALVGQRGELRRELGKPRALRIG